MSTKTCTWFRGRAIVFRRSIAGPKAMFARTNTANIGHVCHVRCGRCLCGHAGQVWAWLVLGKEHSNNSEKPSTKQSQRDPHRLEECNDMTTTNRSLFCSLTHSLSITLSHPPSRFLCLGGLIPSSPGRIFSPWGEGPHLKARLVQAHPTNSRQTQANHHELDQLRTTPTNSRLIHKTQDKLNELDTTPTNSKQTHQTPHNLPQLKRNWRRLDTLAGTHLHVHQPPHGT